MNFGRSIRGKEAVDNGEAPASVVARWIGNGCSAGWILRHCENSSWHHSNVRRTADGTPTDYYQREAVLARWLLANFAARHDDAAAARRLPALFTLARNWDCSIAHAYHQSDYDDPLDVDELAELLGDVPPHRVERPAVVVESLGRVNLTKREYDRKRGRYVAVERTLTIDGACYKGDWLTWTKTLRTFPQDHWVEASCRCKRDSIIKIEQAEK